MAKDLKNTPKVLGLDISTKTIGWSLFEIQTQKLLELTHFSPVIKPQPKVPASMMFDSNGKLMAN